MDGTTISPSLQAMEPLEDMEALSLYRMFEQISDQRHKRGVRYPLAIILSLVVLGKLTGMTSLVGIAEWARLRADWLTAVLPLTRASLPCASTYGNVTRQHRSGGTDADTGGVVDAPVGESPLWRRTQSVADPARSASRTRPGRARWENPAGHARPRCS